MNQRLAEILVGFFVLLAIIAMLILALRVSGLTDMDSSSSYEVYAEFDNIGGLKVGAPLTIAGVKVGQVDDITLDPVKYRAVVTLDVYNKSTKIQTDSSASILTAGILGAQYVSITPGWDPTYLKNKQVIKTTHSALVLENLIGQLMYNLKSD